jgi:hypothetical protein
MRSTNCRTSSRRTHAGAGVLLVPLRRPVRARAGRGTGHRRCVLAFRCSPEPLKVEFEVVGRHYSGRVRCGNLFLASDIPDVPVVSFESAEPGTLYTLMMIDPDGDAHGSLAGPRSTWQERAGAPLDFIEKHRLGQPIASNFFVAIYTSVSPFSGKPFHGNAVEDTWHRDYGEGVLAP